ncbi:MAG: hypothetical protein MJK14_09220 [Rivularia sp. ALOHA_DT_140]|nr:hypothetical protein [Rivularia sp. ALOHA_DT_140]
MTVALRTMFPKEKGWNWDGEFNPHLEVKNGSGERGKREELVEQNFWRNQQKDSSYLFHHITRFPL